MLHVASGQRLLNPGDPVMVGVGVAPRESVALMEDDGVKEGVLDPDAVLVAVSEGSYGGAAA